MSESEHSEKDIAIQHTIGRSRNPVGRFRWSPDGKHIAISNGRSLSIWTENGLLVQTNQCQSAIGGLEWSRNGRLLAVGESNSQVQLLETGTWKPGTLLSIPAKRALSLSFSHDDQYLAIGTDSGLLLLYSLAEKTLKPLSQNEHGKIYATAWSKDPRQMLAYATGEVIWLWSPGGGAPRPLLDHEGPVFSLSFYRKTLASVGRDSIIRLWNTLKGHLLQRLEGHAGSGRSVDFTNDGRKLVSADRSGTVMIWATKNWAVLHRIQVEPHENFYILPGAVFHPCKSNRVAIPGQRDTEVQIRTLSEKKKAMPTRRFTTTKIVLLGEGGVGKSGLRHRLTEGQFAASEATHGQVFVVLDVLRTRTQDGTEHQAVLCDLAGQADYRLIHPLFMDHIDIALILFDPSERQKPLKGVEFWLNILNRSRGRPSRIFLIAARIDVGSPTLRKEEILKFCDSRQIDTYLETSAKTGRGIDVLLEKLKSAMEHTKNQTTITTDTFQQFKDYIFNDKRQAKESLVAYDQLEESLSGIHPTWKLSRAEMRQVITNMANHGFVHPLKDVKGKEYLLMAPDLLGRLLSSVIQKARANPRGLGAVNEWELLRGEYAFPELQRLSEAERKILLDAAASTLILHNLCLRASVENDNSLLIFPALINIRRLSEEQENIVEGATYIVTGLLENTYAILVVLLGYFPIITRVEEWQNQAHYKLNDETCGFKMYEQEKEGEAHFVLLYSAGVSDSTKHLFQSIFESLLKKREVQWRRYESVECNQCGNRIGRDAVDILKKEERDFVFCLKCGVKIFQPHVSLKLPKYIIDKISDGADEVKFRTAYEHALVRFKRYLDEHHLKKKPTCFLSYSSGDAAHQQFLKRLEEHLRKADIQTIIDYNDSPPGQPLSLFLDQILTCDTLLMCCTTSYHQKIKEGSEGTPLNQEYQRILVRWKQGLPIIPLLLDGSSFKRAVPRPFDTVVGYDFRKFEHNFVGLIKLVGQIHRIPLNAQGFNVLVKDLEKEIMSIMDPDNETI
ncbi:MAG: GTP-binding protein [Acidobacteriota bacterium]|nr:GTP-binding protein [Acidobacteriota bacterium]